VARAAVSARRRNAPRSGALCQWTDGGARRRTRRQAAATFWYLGGGGLRRQQYREIHRRYGVRERAPAEPLHILETDSAAPTNEQLRCSLARSLLRSPRTHQYPAPGAAAAQRAAVRRVLPGAGGAGNA